MGYYANGTFTIRFESVAKRDEAFKALKDEGGFTPYTTGREYKDFCEMFSDVWEPGYTDDLEFTGYSSEKWRDDFETFAKIVAPFTNSLFGEFRGEDDSAWAWSRGEDGSLVDESLMDVAVSRYDLMSKDSEALNKALDAVKAGDMETAIREIKLRGVAVALPDDLREWASDSDPAVAAAASERIIKATTGN